MQAGVGSRAKVRIVCGQLCGVPSNFTASLHTVPGSCTCASSSPVLPRHLPCHLADTSCSACRFPLCRAPAPKPMGAAGADGNLAAGSAGQQLSGDAWLAMALASGWRQDMPKRKALEQAFGSVLVF